MGFSRKKATVSSTVIILKNSKRDEYYSILYGILYVYTIYNYI